MFPDSLAHAPHSPIGATSHRVRRSACVFLLALALIVCLAGCQTPVVQVAFDVWPAYQDDALSRLPSGSATPAVAIRETAAFRIRVLSRDQDVAAPSIRVMPPTSGTHSFDAVDVRLFRMHPVAVTDWPGWHIRSVPPGARNDEPLDALVPVDGNSAAMPDRLLSRQPLDVWLDVTVPVGTPAGDYVGGIELWSGSRRVDRRELSFEVLPLTLPLDELPPLIAEIDHRALFAHHVWQAERPYLPPVDDWMNDPHRDALDRVLRASLGMLSEHGLNPVLPWLQPPVLVGARGEPAFDWQQYDAVAGLVLSEAPGSTAAPAIRWPLPTSGLEAAATNSAGRGLTPDFQDAYLRQCIDHFAGRGWLSNAYVLAHGSNAEPTGVPPAWCHGLASNAGPHPSVVNPISTSTVAQGDPGAQACASEWLAPPVSVMPRRREKPGLGTWLALGAPPFSGSTDYRARPVDVRVLPWSVRRLGADAAHLGCVNRWPGATGRVSPTDCARSEPTLLLYPGSVFGLPTPVASVRLKWLRRGREDLALLRLLEQHGREDIATALLDAVVPVAGRTAADTDPCDGQSIRWPANLSTFEDARRWMLDVLLSPGGSQPPPAIAARRLLDDARTPRLECIGVRIRPNSGRTLIPMVTETALMVETSPDVPAAGRLEYGDRRQNDSGEDARPRRIEIPAGQRRLIALSSGDQERDEDAAATSDQPPLGPRGHRSLPIRLELDDGRTVATHARIACVLAAPALATPRVDGDLSDWPPGDTNTAGDFVLISADGSPDDPRFRPSNPTLAFFLADRDALYVGINCASSSRPFAASSRRSAVEYDDQIPVGEDLVELLIDPLNAGSRDSADLYHLAVKRTGAHVASLGVPLNDACSTSRPWPARIDVAVRDAVGRWTVEVRIPWEAFSGAPTHSTVWGVNVTRFDRARQEFSTWSAARRNAYDPLSLGNLMLP